MSGEFLAAVLGRVEADLADLPATAEEEAWRGRGADEAALLLALLRGFTDGRFTDGRCTDGAAAPGDPGDSDDPDDDALAAHLEGMMVREVPRRPVQRFLRVAAAAAFAELWHRAGPGDATALLRASRLIEGRRRTAERLLHHDHGLAPAPRTMEVV